ncbi:hypothetical protein [Exiguobacterium sp. s193]|uniref:hypothetical protein n=1 Tax=Exiguobacterium sp. s193 TaxID=2751207 RepID=UPI001BE6CA82|nr:hypothetical protein [Exiguobacterium sp. s193]
MDMKEEKRKSKMPFFIGFVIVIFVIVAAALIIYVTSEPKEETQHLVQSAVNFVVPYLPLAS